MPESRTNLNPKPKTSSPYWVGLLLRYSTFWRGNFSSISRSFTDQLVANCDWRAWSGTGYL